LKIKEWHKEKLLMKKDRPKLNALILQYLRDESLEGTQMNGRSLKQR
jgi:hypothetical protein